MSLSRPCGAKRVALVAAGATLAVMHSAWTFVALPPGGSMQSGMAPAALQSSRASSFPAEGQRSMPSALPLLGGLALLAASRLPQRRPAAAPHASVVASAPLAGASLACYEEDEESPVVMHSDGGRRKRLGVGGRVCMLTGAKKFKGFTRSYSEKKNIRYWRPNTRWQKLWWDKEKKWVRLYISIRGMRLVDRVGLDAAAKKAGLDLYAWCKPHWEPGSRQPLCLKVGYTGQAKKDLKQWPDYIRYLNDGKPLADRFAGPDRLAKPLPWKLRKTLKNPATPPRSLAVTQASPA
eukprot:gb/GFBE01037604.1/.p1 GENE.gb/GFBE01037604.1/~~gb/GFBE01037604.1/.p1  ORF type:complete len:293 (+),score=57.74 gb/GFBE01037604.1/:1-879(+)